jgi:hypothetical protein
VLGSLISGHSGQSLNGQLDCELASETELRRQVVYGGRRPLDSPGARGRVE